MAMYRYVAKRILYGLFVIWLVATVVFFGLRALPGGPAQTILGGNVSQEAIRELRQQLGLNRPLWVQYVDYLTDFITFDFGRSLSSGKQISTVIGNTGPRTLSLATVGVVTGLALSIPTGIVSALYKDTVADYVATVSAFLGLSMPAFYIGILLAILFGVQLGWLPIFGYKPLSAGVVPWLKHIIMPGIAVGLPYAAVIMRMTRSSLLEVMGSQYMKTARAKGVGSRVRLFKHAFQNALIPVVTVVGIQLAIIIIGSVTVELVFGIQGIGRLLVDSILTRNYPLTQVVIVLTSAVLVGMNLLVDIVYTLIDPRIRYGGGAA